MGRTPVKSDALFANKCGAVGVGTNTFGTVSSCTCGLPCASQPAPVVSRHTLFSVNGNGGAHATSHAVVLPRLLITTGPSPGRGGRHLFTRVHIASGARRIENYPLQCNRKRGHTCHILCGSFARLLITTGPSPGRDGRHREWRPTYREILSSV